MGRGAMHFSTRILRPPYEARSKFLQVTSGCSHNMCKFCSYYHDVDFKISPKDEIVNDLKELRLSGYTFRRLWLQSADPFVLSTDDLLILSNLIHEYLPFIESIGCYARITNLQNKSVDDLIKLKKAGYDSIVFGFESADDYVLDKMNKGYDSNEILKQLSKMDEAGIKYTAIFLNGLAGHGYGSSHAIKTAKLLNKLHPERIMILGLTIFNQTPIFKEIQQGNYVESSEKEKIKELIIFLDNLEIQTFIDATHASNVKPFFGRVPENKVTMINSLVNFYNESDENFLRRKRKKIHNV